MWECFLSVSRTIFTHSSCRRMMRMLSATYPYSSLSLDWSQYDDDAHTHKHSRHYRTSFHTAKQLSNCHFSHTWLMQEREPLHWKYFSVIWKEEAIPGYILTDEYFGEGERCQPMDKNSPPRIHLALLAVSLTVEVKLKQLWKLNYPLDPLRYSPSGQSLGRLAGDCKKICTSCFGLFWERLSDQHLSLVVNSLTHPFFLFIFKNLG